MKENEHIKKIAIRPKVSNAKIKFLSVKKRGLKGEDSFKKL